MSIISGYYSNLHSWDFCWSTDCVFSTWWESLALFFWVFVPVLSISPISQVPSLKREFSTFPEKGKSANGHMVTVLLFFPLLNRFNCFWEHLSLLVCIFLRENEDIPLDIKWIKVKISSGASVETENFIFRHGGVVVRQLNLRKPPALSRQNF